MKMGFGLILNFCQAIVDLMRNSVSADQELVLAGGITSGCFYGARINKKFRGTLERTISHYCSKNY